MNESPIKFLRPLCVSLLAAVTSFAWLCASACAIQPEVGQTIQEVVGECSSTAECQQLYESATDCKNSEGGVCYCGSALCASASEPPGSDGPLGQCSETSDRQVAYPSLQGCLSSQLAELVLSAHFAVAEFIRDISGAGEVELGQ